jgi:hypothetical protein
MPTLAERFRLRINELTLWMRKNCPECLVQQRHLNEGSTERSYWNYGYLSALKDVLTQVRKQS